MASKSGVGNIQPVQVAAIIGLVMVVAAAVFYWFFYKGLEDQEKGLDTKIAEEQTKVVKLQRVLADLKAIENEEAKIKARLKEIQKRLPKSEEEFHEFLRSIYIKGKNNSIDVKRFEKLEVEIGDLYDTIPIEMDFAASYDAATNFFWDLSLMGEVSEAAEVERIVNVRQLSVERRKGQAPGMVTISCLVETYLCSSCEQLAGGEAQ